MTRRGASPAANGALAEVTRVVAARMGIAIAFDVVDGEGRTADRAAGLRVAAVAMFEATGARPEIAGHHPDGRPRWPDAATGSIAHAGGIALAAVRACRSSTRSRVAAVGVDIEIAGALPATDAGLVLDATERAAVAADRRPDHLATMIWSAKEAAFKAWCEATDGGLGTVDPVDIHVEFGPLRDGLRAVRVHANGSLATPVAPVGPVTGWCAETGGYVLVVVSARGAHHGVDGMASAAITKPSAANATT